MIEDMHNQTQVSNHINCVLSQIRFFLVILGLPQGTIAISTIRYISGLIKHFADLDFPEIWEYPVLKPHLRVNLSGCTMYSINQPTLVPFFLQKFKETNPKMPFNLDGFPKMPFNLDGKVVGDDEMIDHDGLRSIESWLFNRDFYNRLL